MIAPCVVCSRARRQDGWHDVWHRRARPRTQRIPLRGMTHRVMIPRYRTLRIDAPRIARVAEA